MSNLCQIAVEHISKEKETWSNILASTYFLVHRDQIGKPGSNERGGIPGVLFTPSSSDEEFERFAITVIKQMVSKPQYVLGIADQIPPDGIIDRIKKITDLVEKYGKYRNN